MGSAQWQDFNATLVKGPGLALLWEQNTLCRTWSVPEQPWIPDLGLALMVLPSIHACLEPQMAGTERDLMGPKLSPNPYAGLRP